MAAIDHKVEPHFVDLIHKIAKEQDFVKYDLDIAPMSSGGANYTSTLYTATIKDDSRSLHLFAKVSCIGKKMRTQLPKVYEVERYCYTELVNIYEKLQEDQQIPNEHKLAWPKFYGCNPKLYEETIVLENLAMEGYNSFDRLKSFDWPYAKAAVTELAKMHAVSMAHWKRDPEEFAELTKKLVHDWDPETPENQTYTQMTTTKALEIMQGENKVLLQKYFDNLDFHELAATFRRCRRKTLNHGDYKPSNLMHKNLEDGSVDIKIVDLQTLQAGSPVTDLIYFIFTGSDEEFRGKYFEQLVDYYYSQLRAAMKRLHLDPEELFSREDFDFEFKDKLPYGLTLAVFTLPVVTVDVENAPVVDESLDMSNFTVAKTSALYAERLNGVINDYVKWGLLK